MGSIQEANVAALLVQAVLYGSYLVLVIPTLRCLVFEDRGWKPRKSINRLLVSTTVIFFVFSTSDLSLSLSMSIAAMRGQTTTYNKYGTVNNIIENTTIMMADAVLINRCWIVYAKSWRVVFTPFLTWLAALSCFVLVICSQLSITWESWFYHFWVGFYSSNILTNIYATAAIIYRLFVIANQTVDRQSSRSGRLHKISRIVFESGFLYTLTSSVNLAASVVGGPPIVRYVSDAVNFSMAGITFNLLILRVFLHRRDYYADSQDSRDSIIATPQLSGSEFKSTSHTSELSTPTLVTSNEEDYIEVQSRANTPLLECASDGIGRDFAYTSSSKNTIYSTNPTTTDHLYSWTH